MTLGLVFLVTFSTETCQKSTCVTLDGRNLEQYIEIRGKSRNNLGKFVQNLEEFLKQFSKPWVKVSFSWLQVMYFPRWKRTVLSRQRKVFQIVTNCSKYYTLRIIHGHLRDRLRLPDDFDWAGQFLALSATENFWHVSFEKVTTKTRLRTKTASENSNPQCSFNCSSVRRRKTQQCEQWWIRNDGEHEAV